MATKAQPETKMILPTKKVKTNLSEDAEFMILFGKPKCGKTTMTSFLENALHVDFEKGSGYVDVASVEVNVLSDLKKLIAALTESKHRYDYIVLDTATAMEDKLLPYAKALYRETPMGKDFTGDVRALPNGAGYLYLREAFLNTVDKFKPFTDHLILVGHTKDKQIKEGGTELSENTIDLTGKLERLVCAKADAIGYIYRKDDETMLNFKGGEDYIIGARPKHLRNKEFVMMKSDSNGDIKSANWNQIFTKA